MQLSSPFHKSSCVYYLVLRFLSSCFCPSLSSIFCFFTSTFTRLPSSHLAISFSFSSSVFFVLLSFFFLLGRSSTRLPSKSNSAFPVSSSCTWPLWQDRVQLPSSAQLQWLSPHQSEHVQPQRLSSIASQSVCLSLQQPGWATLDILCSWPSCLLHGWHRHQNKHGWPRSSPLFEKPSTQVPLPWPCAKDSQRLHSNHGKCAHICRGDHSWVWYQFDQAKSASCALQL